MIDYKREMQEYDRQRRRIAVYKTAVCALGAILAILVYVGGH